MNEGVVKKRYSQEKPDCTRRIAEKKNKRVNRGVKKRATSGEHKERL